jgi:hypothetical protein
VQLPFALLFKSIAERKGRNKWSWFIIGLIPVVNAISGLYLVSLPDEKLLNMINTIINVLQKHGIEPNKDDFSQGPKTSKEQIHDIDWQAVDSDKDQ